MGNIHHLEQVVREKYEAKDPGRGGWADWMYENHVFVVANYAEKLAERFGASVELSRAAAMLHDISDIKMERSNEDSEETSLQIARELLEQAGFSDEDIQLVVDDAIKWHSCYDGNAPKSKEGQVLATADALAHLQTGFYIFASWAFGKEGRTGLDGLREWALKKMDRDFNDKIRFDEVREEARDDYEHLRTLFSR